MIGYTTGISRRFQFCAGHRIYGHESKCRHLHGHNYVAHVHVSAARLDKLGRVIDFSVVKDKVGAWIDEKWDHGFICWRHDDRALEACAAFDGNQKVYAMDVNPTAENMALHLLHVAAGLLAEHGVDVTAVELEETENCKAMVFAVPGPIGGPLYMQRAT